MSTEFPIKARLTAKDDMSKVVDRVGKAVRKDLGGAAEAGGRKVDGLARATDKAGRSARRARNKIGKMARATRGLKRAARGGGRMLGKLAGGFAKVTALAGVGSLGAATAGVVSFGRHSIKANAELLRTSKRLGLTVESLQAFEGAAEAGGVKSGAFTEGIAEMNKKLGELRTGKGSGRLDTILKKMGKPGKALKDALKGAKSTEAALGTVMGVLKSIDDVGQRTKLADSIFGGGASKEILALVDDYGKLLKVGQDNVTVTTKQAEAAKVLDRKMNIASVKIGGLAAAIGVKMMPVLEPMIDSFGQWIDANDEIIASKAGEYVQKFGDYLKNVDWGEVAHKLGIVADAFGAIGTALVKSLGYLDTFGQAIGEGAAWWVTMYQKHIDSPNDPRKAAINKKIVEARRKAIAEGRSTADIPTSASAATDAQLQALGIGPAIPTVERSIASPHFSGGRVGNSANGRPAYLTEPIGQLVDAAAARVAAATAPADATAGAVAGEITINVKADAGASATVTKTIAAPGTTIKTRTNTGSRKVGGR